MDELSTKQLFEEARMNGKVLYKISLMPELEIDDTFDFLDRLNRSVELAKKAYAANCYGEYISFMMLYLEVWMRIFLVCKGIYQGMNIYKDKLCVNKSLHINMEIGYLTI